VKKKEYDEIRKQISEQIEIQLEELTDVLGLFNCTLTVVKKSTRRSEYQENYIKLMHLKTQYELLKTEIQDIRYKEIHLNLLQHDFTQFEEL
jgi:hypothetical protein